MNCSNKYRTQQQDLEIEIRLFKTYSFTNSNSRDDSDSETEDEDAEKWTEEDEKDFFKTLSNLKQKNAKIYDGQTSFFKKSFFETGPSFIYNWSIRPHFLT